MWLLLVGMCPELLVRTRLKPLLSSAAIHTLLSNPRLSRQALDYVLHSAAQHGVRLILVVGSTGSAIGQGAAGTPANYMQWVAGSLNR